MENEKKGNGIFLGIIGVATLIVAIIGASFAYFSIQASSEPGAVDVTAYHFSATLSMSEIKSPGDKGIIPVDPDGAVNGATAPNNTNWSYALNVKNETKTRSCVDGAGHGICALYQVTISNDSEEALGLDGVIKTISNEAGKGGEAFSNLRYRILTKVDEVDGENIYEFNSTDPDESMISATGEVSLGHISVPARVGENAGTYTTYILVYLNEIEDDQSAEMGATYTGQVIYTSDNTASRLTGTFNLS